MLYIEVKDNCVFLKGEPLMETVSHFLEDFKISVNGQFDHWSNQVPEEYLKQAKKEAGECEWLINSGKLEDLNNINDKLNQTLQKLLDFKVNIERNINIFSLDNIMINNDDDEYEYMQEYLIASPKSKVLTSLMILQSIRLEKVHSSGISYDEKLKKAGTSLENKKEELKECEDESFVKKNLAPLQKIYNKIQKDQAAFIKQKSAKQKEVEQFLEKHDMKKIYDWFSNNIKFDFEPEEQKKKPKFK